MGTVRTIYNACHNIINNFPVTWGLYRRSVMTEFLYKDPNFEPDKDGNRVIIDKCCIGPIEVIIYGITKENEYYLDWTFPEFYPGDQEVA
jgi:hypothetical protein